MRIVVVSTFRDAVGYLPQYLDQTTALAERAADCGHEVTFLWCENDSVDSTFNVLNDYAAEHGYATVIQRPTGAPYYQSTEIHNARWANVAKFSNATLDELPDCDVMVWVESDLIWEPDTLLQLATGAIAHGATAAPVWRRGTFYDIFTTRKDGAEYRPPQGEGYVKIDSCAGCIAMHIKVARKARFADDSCASFTRDVGGVWLNTDLAVEHP